MGSLFPLSPINIRGSSDEGMLNLAEAVLGIAARDYKFCWALKTLYKAGDWFFVGKIKRESPYKTKFEGAKCVVARGGSAGMRGQVDDNIERLENYFQYHPIVAHLADEIIQFLREDALTDKVNLKLAETAKKRAN